MCDGGGGRGGQGAPWVKSVWGGAAGWGGAGGLLHTSEEPTPRCPLVSPPLVPLFRRLVGELWERTAPGGVLLLVEPGTPSGGGGGGGQGPAGAAQGKPPSSCRPALGSLAVGCELARGLASTQNILRAWSNPCWLPAAGAGHVQRARSQLLEGKAARGAGGGGGAGAAHVVAPCPHDGACPLEGRPSWCHFVQRFQVGQKAQEGCGQQQGVQAPQQGWGCATTIRTSTTHSPSLCLTCPIAVHRSPSAAHAAAACRQGHGRHPASYLPG